MTEAELKYLKLRAAIKRALEQYDALGYPPERVVEMIRKAIEEEK